MNDEFYKAFEDEFRGEEEEIKRKLTFYTPLLKAYSEAYPSSKPKALDIGCGRGEMLSLYEELGFEAFGIDTNKIMVSYASSKGLNVELSDAISFLKAQDSNTYDVISLIHVLEHLSFEYAFELYKEVFRTLKEGGSFIIEFPYTDNIPMGTIDFYLDPTHLKPIHPKAVKFILEYDGFIGVSYFGVHGYYKDPQSIGFEDAFSYTVAPNVALIATKPTPNKLFLEKLNSYKSLLNPSLSLNDVLYHASQNLNNKFQNISNELKQILDEISSLKSQNSYLSNEVENIKSHNTNIINDLSSLKSQNSYLSNEVENIKSQYSHINNMLTFLKSQIEMITRSKPWRIYAMLGKIKRKLLKKKTL